MLTSLITHASKQVYAPLHNQALGSNHQTTYDTVIHTHDDYLMLSRSHPKYKLVDVHQKGAEISGVHSLSSSLSLPDYLQCERLTSTPTFRCRTRLSRDCPTLSLEGEEFCTPTPNMSNSIARKKDRMYFVLDTRINITTITPNPTKTISQSVSHAANSRSSKPCRSDSLRPPLSVCRTEQTTPRRAGDKKVKAETKG